jgi:hypothetical protein
LTTDFTDNTDPEFGHSCLPAMVLATTGEIAGEKVRWLPVSAFSVLALQLWDSSVPIRAIRG